MYDSDAERLDLFDRFARLCFAMTHNGHGLISTTDAEEAVEDADRIVLQIGANCARIYLKLRHRTGIASLQDDAMIELAVEEMLGSAPVDAEVLSLELGDVAVPRGHFYRVDWLRTQPTASDRRSLPHQVLRWIRGEEYAHELLRLHERSPLKRWLDDVSTAERVERAYRG